MSAVDTTTHATVIPTVWEPMFEFVAQQPRGVAEKFWDVSERTQGPGKIFKINILPKLSVVAGFGSGDLRVWAAGSTVNYVSSLTSLPITLTQSLKHVGIQIEPDIEDFSVSALADAYVPVLAEAVYQGLDIDILNLYSEFNSSDTVGSSTSNFTLADFLLALQRLRSNAKDKMADGEPFVGIYNLGQMDKILSYSDIVNAAVRGTGPGAAVNGKIPLVYGGEILLTGNVISSTGRRNLVAARKAIVWGKKYAAKIETDRQDLITKVIAYCNWGVKSAHSYTTYSSTGGSDLAVGHTTS